MRFQKLNAGLLPAVVVFWGVLAGCEKNPAEAQPENPQELITTVLVRVWDEPDSVHTHTFAFRDLDGPGGQPPLVDTLHFHGHAQSWRLSLEFLNEAKEPTDTLTAEIRREAEAHQVFYELSPELQSSVRIERLDRDRNGLPLGLQARVTLQGYEERHGSLRIRLFHYDAEPKTEQPGGETDVDVTFPVHIMPD
ncbi:hypothetical protein HRbin21_00036 [bacterium HR21]|nr:hypothetical protein HRbin21_00036 [bacterium HR21]